MLESNLVKHPTPTLPLCDNSRYPLQPKVLAVLESVGLHSPVLHMQYRLFLDHVLSHCVPLRVQCLHVESYSAVVRGV